MSRNGEECGVVGRVGVIGFHDRKSAASKVATPSMTSVASNSD